MSPADAIVYVTTRIETRSQEGAVGSGTGFFFLFFSGSDDTSVPAIVTNKHVLDGAARAVFYISVSTESGTGGSKYIPIEIPNVQQVRIDHPDPDVDLTIVLITPVLRQLQLSNMEPQFQALAIDQILTDEQLQDLTAIEEVHMVGYPNGVWDSRNNLPIVRRGITATPLYVDYEDTPRFLIDAACFPGSSGSPVVLLNTGAFAKKDGSISVGARFGLLGILYAGPIMTQQGRIQVVDGPTAATPIAVTNLMINLGYCIKAKRLIEFEDQLIRMGIEPPRGYVPHSTSRIGD